MYVISSDSPLLADDETYLAHYGIKGQKWGIVRTPEQLRRARGTKPWESGTSTKKETPRFPNEICGKIYELAIRFFGMSTVLLLRVELLAKNGHRR